MDQMKNPFPIAKGEILIQLKINLTKDLHSVNPTEFHHSQSTAICSNLFIKNKVVSYCLVLQYGLLNDGILKQRQISNRMGTQNSLVFKMMS